MQAAQWSLELVADRPARAAALGLTHGASLPNGAQYTQAGTDRPRPANPAAHL